MTVVALVTAREALGLDEDLPALAAALADLGVSTAFAAWDDASTDWSQYAAVVIRSPWDYVSRRDEFCAWAESVEGLTALWNHAEIVRWNTDKRYLAELAGAGLPVVPTCFVGPGAPGSVSVWPTGELVVKPAVGAGSKGAARFAADDTAAARDHAEHLVGTGTLAMVQPYLAAVDDVGETALVHIDGVFSHAMRKGPLLSVGAGAVEGLYAEEDMRPRTATTEERALADRIMAWVDARFGRPLYARVDLLPGPDGRPLLLELELCEPSLFLPYDPDAADRLARAIVARLPGGVSGAEP